MSDVEAPPVELILRVVGTEDVEAFLRSGHDAGRPAGRAAASGRATSSRSSGTSTTSAAARGRLERALRERAPQARLTATDVDEEAIAWLAEHMPDVDVRVNPLAAAAAVRGDGAFDLVIVISVFTHLPRDYQDAWLAELRRGDEAGRRRDRLDRPRRGALAPDLGRRLRGRAAAGAPAARSCSALERRLRGFTHWRGDGWERIFPDYYHTSWHRPGYVRRHWSRWFDVVRMEEGTDAGRPRLRRA